MKPIDICVREINISTPIVIVTTFYLSQQQPYDKILPPYFTVLKVLVIMLLCPFNSWYPGRTTRHKCLLSGFQQRILQLKIIHRSDTKNALPRKPRANPVHEGAASGTEVIGHGISRSNSLVLSKCCHVLLTANVLEMCVLDDETGCEHRGGDLAAVVTVTHECFDEAWTVKRLCYGLEKRFIVVNSSHIG